MPQNHEPSASAADSEPESGTVVVTNGAVPGAFSVTNNGAEITLSRRVVVEQPNDSGRTATDADGRLISNCDEYEDQSPRLLQAGQSLQAVAWNGMTCGGQCPASCRANVYLGPGEFRLVVLSADESNRFEGPAFQLPAEPAGHDAPPRRRLPRLLHLPSACGRLKRVMFCSACAFPIEAEDYFCRRCGAATEAGADVKVTIRPRLRRASNQEKKVAGVCGGVARYFNKDPRLVRAVWTGASLLPFFPGVIAYGICWAVMPRGAKPEPAKPQQRPTVITAKTGHAA